MSLVIFVCSTNKQKKLLYKKWFSYFGITFTECKGQNDEKKQRHFVKTSI